MAAELHETTIGIIAPTSPSAGPSLVFRPVSYVETLDLAALFPLIQPVEVELGSGDGSFLAQYAQAHPELNLLGVERLLGRLRKEERKGLRAHLTNLRLLRLEAGYVVEYLLPPASLQALHIYFPDPWPKRRHHRRRLINERFPELARRALVPGGMVYLRTDNQDYCAQMTEVFVAHAAFQPRDTPASLSALITDFERAFLAQKVPIHRLAFTKVA